MKIFIGQRPVVVSAQVVEYGVDVVDVMSDQQEAVDEQTDDGQVQQVPQRQHEQPDWTRLHQLTSTTRAS